MEQVINVNGERVIITEETIKATYQWYADNAQGYIDKALSGKVRVNDVHQYIIDKTTDKINYLNGKFQKSLAFWQQAYYIQSGECVGILG